MSAITMPYRPLSIRCSFALAELGCTNKEYGIGYTQLIPYFFQEFFNHSVSCSSVIISFSYHGPVRSRQLRGE